MQKLAAVIAGTMLLMACGSEPKRETLGGPVAEKAPAGKAGEPAGNLYLTLETDMGDIRCKLFEKEAPIAVERITKLAKNQFYDGLTFHRVIPNFMIQTGDPTGTGSGGARGPGFPFEDEFNPNLNFDVPGRLGLANPGIRDSNNSQFFIAEQPVPHLNGRHTIFGDCTGLAVVRKIARVRRDERTDKPLVPVKIKRAAVERVPPGS